MFIFFILYNTLCLSQNKQQNGYVKFTYPNGKISSAGLMVNAKPDGFWKTYYVTGVVKSEGNRNNFLLDSIWLFYNELGDTTEKISYVLGKKNGYYYQYSTIEEKNETRKNIIVSKELYINDIKEGLSYYYYPNGKVHEIINYKKNKRQGIGKEFNNDSLVITIYEYFNDYLIDKQNINRTVKGQKDGLWKEFYKSGIVKSEKTYRSDQLSGYSKEYDKKGNISLALLYDSGKLVQKGKDDTLNIDERIVYDEKGKMLKRGYYKNNIPTGIHREYDSNGKVTNAFVYDENGKIVSQGIINDDGTREGKWDYFYDDGEVKSEGLYVNNRQDGEWKFFFRGGKTEQLGNFSSGVLNDIWKWFYPTGNVLRIENFSKGKREGLYVELSVSGDTIVKGTYLDGEKNGFWRTKSGDVIEEGKYVNDLKEGAWETYYLNGVLMYQGNYIQGNADGRHIYYYDTGRIREEQNYVNGIKEKLWRKFSPDGNIFLTVYFENDIETRINGINVQKIKRN